MGCNTRHALYHHNIIHCSYGDAVIVKVVPGVGLAKAVDFPTLNVFSEELSAGIYRVMTEWGPASLFVLDDDGFGECHITGRTDIPEGLNELSVENIEDMPIPPSGLLEIISLGIEVYNNRRNSRLDYYK